MPTLHFKHLLIVTAIITLAVLVTSLLTVHGPVRTGVAILTGVLASARFRLLCWPGKAGGPDIDPGTG